MTSLIIQQFSELLENPEVLNNPQKYLGPHYKKLLKFWNKIEKMTEEQLRIVNERHVAFYRDNFSEWYKASDLAINTSKELVGQKYAFEASWAALTVTNSDAADWATLELIGGVENPVFLKMFDNL